MLDQFDTDAASGKLPAGTQCLTLQMHSDERGIFTELHRLEWDTGVKPIQWNMVKSKENVLRGVHVHIKHWDYLIVSSGHATVGLRDLRHNSITFGLTTLFELDANSLQSIIIPPGVAHGFYFHEVSTHIYAVSEYWNTSDELGCHWADAALEMRFPVVTPSLSTRDAHACSFEDLMRQLEPFQGGF